MHIPHNISHLAGAMQIIAPQTSNARKPAGKRLREADSFDSLLDIVILSEDGEPEGGGEEPEGDRRR